MGKGRSSVVENTLGTQKILTYPVKGCQVEGGMEGCTQKTWRTATSLTDNTNLGGPMVGFIVR